MHHGHEAAGEPSEEMVESMGETDAKAYARVLARYERYKDMYTNCTVVDGNLEIVFLMGSGVAGNRIFSLDFLGNIREVTCFCELHNALFRFVTIRCGDVSHFATEEPTVRFFHFHSPDGTALHSGEHGKQRKSDAH